VAYSTSRIVPGRNPPVGQSNDGGTDQARAILQQLSDALYDGLTEISADADDATKIDRAAALIRNAAPEITAVVVLGLIASMREYDDRFAVYESLLRKMTVGMMDGIDG
jgi:hypothetical protein